MSALLPKTNLKSRVLFGALWLSALTALPLTSAATVFTYTKGTPTTFTNGNYMSGTMDVNLSVNPPSLTTANINVYNSADQLITTFVAADEDNGLARVHTDSRSCNSPNNLSLLFDNSSFRMTLVFEATNTSSPVPRTSVSGPNGWYTTFNATGASNEYIADSCSNYMNPPSPAAIPTLSEWGMIFMASLLAMFGIRRMRRSK